MSYIRDWEERKYREVFEEVCFKLEQQRLTAPGQAVEVVEGLLESAYIDLGNDWIGRGAVAEITQNATIAAYEHKLAEWRDHPPPGR